MAPLFTTTFTDDYAIWTFAESPFGPNPDPHPFAGWGCSGGFAARCPGMVLSYDLAGNLPGIAWNTPLTAWNYRTQIAFKGPIGHNPASRLFVAFDDVAIPYFEGICGNSFRAFLYIETDGALTITFAGTGTSVPASFSSAAAAMPLDQLFHGLQVSMTPSPTGCDYDVVVDDVSVLSGTYVKPGDPWGNQAGVNQCNIPAGTPITGAWAGMTRLGVLVMQPNSDNTYYCALAEVTVDDDPTIISYPACTTPDDVDLGSCEPPPGTVTSMSIDCDAMTIALLGTGFAASVSVDLQGPNGYVPAGIVTTRVSATEITLSNLPGDFVSGDYCVTVTNL